jgi:hypothetical protein
MHNNNYIIQKVTFGNISTSQPSNTSSIFNILKLEAHGYGNECNNIYIKDVINSISRDITLGRYMNVAIDAKLEAHYQAACYVENQGIPLVDAASNVGEYLATYVLFWHKIATPSASIFVSAKYSEILLKYSHTYPQLISDLYKSGLVKGPKLKVSNNAALNTTSISADEQYYSNSFAFNHRYINKTLELTGSIIFLDSSNSGNEVTIALQGERFNHVYCNITNKNYINQAYNIKKGQSITIIGIYKPSIIFGMELNQCKIQP